MEIKIQRIARKNDYTIGRLYVDGVRLCDTLEDRDRGLKQSMYVEEIRRKKVYGQTAIPAGRYAVRMDVISPLYSKKPFFRDFCGARMPRIMDVPGWDGVLIHPGNTAADTLGCILVGENNQVGHVNRSRDVWQKLYRQLAEAHNRGEKIWLNIE